MKKLTMQEKKEIIIKEYPFANKEELAKRLGYKNASSLRTMASRLGVTKQYKIPDLKDEVWRQAPDFSRYVFSNKGRIKSVSRNRLISQRIHEGYYDCRINNDAGEKKTIRLHRKVAKLFVDNDSEKNIVVNHIDSNKLNNDYTNLEWCTSQQNTQHALNNIDFDWNAKNRLNDKEVNEICKLLEIGYSIKETMSENKRFTRGRVEKIRQRVRHKEISKDYKWKEY